MRSRTFHALGLLTACAVGLGSLSALSSAQTTAQGIDPQGKPKQFEAGELTGFAVWHSKKGWHVRTTTKKKEHHFRGTITVEGGTFVSVHPHDLEKGGKLADWWKLGPKKRELKFEFKTDKGIDGIDFHVSKEAKHIRFRLHFDGKHQKEHIFIGQSGAHPLHDPFTLRAHPQKP
jgi:hypothetical protein